MSKRLLLIGGGGHCKSVLDSALDLGYDDIAIIDQKENIGKSIMGIRIIGCDDDLQSLFDSGYQSAFIVIGNINIREKIYINLKEIGFQIPTIIDNTAIISKFAKVGQGVFIGKGCIVNINAIIGDFAIINTGSIIEHDCQIGDFVNIAPSVTLAGEVTIGEKSNIGLNSCIREQVIVGENTVVGMGSVVTKDVKNYVVAYGNPCREVKTL